MENCQDKYNRLLCQVPSRWRNGLISLICNIEQGVPCTPNCDTLTAISKFRFNGSSICIKYKDENGAIQDRCFDFNQFLDDIDPKCLGTQEEWNSWTFLQRIQKILDRSTIYNCITTSTTTTTTTTVCPSVTNVQWFYV